MISEECLPMSFKKYALKSSLLTQQKMKHHLKRASRLIPLDKNPGLGPIGVNEVL